MVDPSVVASAEDPHPDVHLSDVSERECQLTALADNLVRSQAAALAPSTWSGYQRCHLKKRWLSWAAMATYRSAIRSLSLASGAPDPWDWFPQLKTCVRA
eukprot:1907513-Rhodomonas_salina.1